MCISMDGHGRTIRHGVQFFTANEIFFCEHLVVNAKLALLARLKTSQISSRANTTAVLNISHITTRHLARKQDCCSPEEIKKTTNTIHQNAETIMWRISTLLFVLATGSSNALDAVTLDATQLFNDWVEAHGKDYDTPDEKLARLQIWLENDGTHKQQKALHVVVTNRGR